MALCQICGKPTGCTCKGNWRNVACSVEHFQEYMLQDNSEPSQRSKTSNVPYKLRASINGVVYDVKDYTVGTNDVQLVTRLDDKVISLSETEYVVVLNSEKANLLKSYEDDGRYLTVFSKDYGDMIKYLP